MQNELQPVNTPDFAAELTAAEAELSTLQIKMLLDFNVRFADDLIIKTYKMFSEGERTRARFGQFPVTVERRQESQTEIETNRDILSAIGEGYYIVRRRGMSRNSKSADEFYLEIVEAYLSALVARCNRLKTAPHLPKVS
jgi:hypothetical protein